MRRLRTVAAVFRAAAGFYRKQLRQLYFRRIEGLAVHGGRLKHQFHERQIEQGGDLVF